MEVPTLSPPYSARSPPGTDCFRLIGSLAQGPVGRLDCHLIYVLYSLQAETGANPVHAGKGLNAEWVKIVTTNCRGPNLQARAKRRQGFEVFIWCIVIFVVVCKLRRTCPQQLSLPFQDQAGSPLEDSQQALRLANGSVRLCALELTSGGHPGSWTSPRPSRPSGSSGQGGTVGLARRTGSGPNCMPSRSGGRRGASV